MMASELSIFVTIGFLPEKTLHFPAISTDRTLSSLVPAIMGLLSTRAWPTLAVWRHGERSLADNASLRELFPNETVIWLIFCDANAEQPGSPTVAEPSDGRMHVHEVLVERQRVEKDILEDDQDLGDLDELSSDSEVADSNCDRLGFELALDDPELAPEDESGRQVVALDEEESIDEGAQTLATADFDLPEEDADAGGFGDLDVEANAESCANDSDHFLQSEDEEAEREVKIDPDVVAVRVRRVKVPKQNKNEQDVRRATVRHYSKMNPERVYPLYVLISKDAIETSVSRGVVQRESNLFAVAQDAPIEIEPILPGCDCFPPRISVRLSSKPLKASFRVVPRVLGVVDGASIVVRQNHATLAAVDLEIKVVRRTWAVVMAVLAFLLPWCSTALKHFGLDFETQRQEGFNFYLQTGRVLFDHVPPSGLATLLGVTSAGFWWFSRPTESECDFEFKKIRPESRLAGIQQLAQKAPGRAIEDLNDLLATHPLLGKGWMLLGEIQYRQKSFGEALQAFARGMKLCSATSGHYLRASLAASRCGKRDVALRILSNAEAELPQDKITGPMYFNQGCYHALAGRADVSLLYLRKAVDAGFRKTSSFENDPDLDSIRRRPEFQNLLKELRAHESEVNAK